MKVEARARLDRTAAVGWLREWLLAELRRTGSRAWLEAVSLIDAGWESVQVAEGFGAAFMCSCPPDPFGSNRPGSEDSTEREAMT
ncbi:hypothetical protein [Thermomonospora umbrina]|nr:hypothetical protein [Thermomonospora umbrina]